MMHYKTKTRTEAMEWGRIVDLIAQGNLQKALEIMGGKPKRKIGLTLEESIRYRLLVCIAEHDPREFVDVLFDKAKELAFSVEPDGLDAAKELVFYFLDLRRIQNINSSINFAKTLDGFDVTKKIARAEPEYGILTDGEFIKIDKAPVFIYLDLVANRLDELFDEQTKAKWLSKDRTGYKLCRRYHDGTGYAYRIYDM